jgi:UDP-GlcNAc:undecaprenyl-phosphate GlcNAc-1-phosphate transferase
VREYVLTLLVTAAVTYILTPLVRRGAIKAGAQQAVRDRDVHVVPIPRLGGLAMYAGLAVGLLVAAQMSPLDSVLSGSNMAIGLLLAGGLVVAMGIIDDRWGMNAISKLAGQVAAGVILVASGCELGWLPLPGGGTFSPTSNQALVLTVLVVVATINAVNFIDGLDGLAAGIVAIAAISFFLYYYSLTHTLRLSAEAAPTLASALLAGMCLGFLPHNFFPARIFMGDTGSMLLGLLLAYVPISSITTLDPRTLTGAVNRFPEVLPLLLPTTILVIPYADMLMAVVRRTRAGMSPFAADRKHLHHRLLDIGHSHRLSVLIMYLWAAMFSGLIVWFSTVRTPLFAFAVITLAAVLALLLMSMPRLRWWQRARRKSLAPAVAAPAARPGPAAAGPAGPAVTASLGTAAAAAGAPVLTREPVSPLAADDLLPAGRDPAPPGTAASGIAASGIAASGAMANGAAGGVGRSPWEPAPPGRPPVPPALPVSPMPPARPARSVVGTIPPAVPLGAPPPDPLHPDISGPDTLSDDAMSSGGHAPDLLAAGPLTPDRPGADPLAADQAGQGTDGDGRTRHGAGHSRDADRPRPHRRPPRRP